MAEASLTSRTSWVVASCMCDHRLALRDWEVVVRVAHVTDETTRADNAPMMSITTMSSIMVTPASPRAVRRWRMGVLSQ
jgi:hypothetical protein